MLFALSFGFGFGLVVLEVKSLLHDAILGDDSNENGIARVDVSLTSGREDISHKVDGFLLRELGFGLGGLLILPSELHERHHMSMG